MICMRIIVSLTNWSMRLWNSFDGVYGKEILFSEIALKVVAAELATMRLALPHSASGLFQRMDAHLQVMVFSTDTFPWICYLVVHLNGL